MTSISELYSGGGSTTSAETMLYTFDEATLVNVDEKKILNALHQGNADDIAFTANTFTKKDIGVGIDDGVMVTNELPESSTIMSLKFEHSTAVLSNQHSADLIYGNQSASVPTAKKNTMELGPDTAPLYVGHLKFEFTNGPSVYTSDANGHRISLDTTHADCNYFKAANSVLSNLDSNPTNGIQGGFDNTFNSTHAFYTENIISRDPTSNQLVAGSSLGDDGIRSSTNNKLTVEILDTTSANVPFFGALKMVQDTLQATFDTTHNNTNDNSTMSSVARNADLSQVPIAISAPPRDMQEPEFKALFTNGDLAKVGPGYTLDVVIGAQQLGGYALDSSFNTVAIPMYDNMNVKESTSITGPMFELDDSDIHENLRYMWEMKENTLFGSHAFNIKNGTLQKDPNQDDNKNYNDFTVLDGAESLRVITTNGIDDLTQSGIIKVIDTNNTLGDGDARYTKISGGSANVDRLIVNYEAGETDHLPTVGSLSQPLQDKYFVKSKIAVLAKSTNTTDNQWNAITDVAMTDDSALVFQSTPDSTLFNKNNISAYSAPLLNSAIGTDEFALISLKKFYDLSSSYGESPMFKTFDNTALPVTSSIRLSVMNLNDISFDDLRVNLTCKKGSEMPSITQLTNSPPSSWKTSSSETADLSYNSTTTTMGNENSNYLISQKGGKTLLGPDIYKMMNQQNPLNPLNVTIELTTNEHDVENRDILELKAFVTLNLPSGTGGDIINKTVEVDEKDLVIQPIGSENESWSVIQDLTGLSGWLTGTLSNYEVKQYVTTKQYNACIRVKIGPYKNLWHVTRVKEEITWYTLFDINQAKVLPDHYLSQIKNVGGAQAFKTRSRFIGADTTKILKIGSTSEFTVADLMGFKVGVEYGVNGAWTPFTLASDSYGNSADLMYDQATTVALTTNAGNFGNLTLSIDSPKLLSLGSESHKSPTHNPMYMINLSIPKGKTAFQAVGYKYSIANHSQHFNKGISWSPYAVDDALFLKNGSSNVGENMQLTTIVELIDPTADANNVNEVNKVKVRIMSGSIELASFISDKWILENFNIIMNRGPIVQHDYVVSRTDHNNFATEYLHTSDHSTITPNSFYAKLLFKHDSNQTYDGVRVELLKTSVRDDASEFQLNGDRLYMSPLVGGIDNAYTGPYSTASGIEIQPSASGYPLPTNSLYHRNICPTKFRGYKNGQAPINVLRTMTRIKMVFGDMFQDDMNTHSISNTGGVWKDRGSNDTYSALEANDIRSVVTGGVQPGNMNSNITHGTSIGSLGLKVVPKYSMFPTIIGSFYQIPITVTPATYTKTITNDLDTSMNDNGNSTVFDVVLHSFVPFDIVATRIKAYAVEKFNLKYGVPNLQVYYSPQYVGDPKNFTWSVPIASYSDAQLREINGQVVSYHNFDGVVKFKRDLNPVSSYIKYGILPRPIAFAEAYDITDLSTKILPSDLSTITRKRYYCDIDITATTTTKFNKDGDIYGQGLATTLQQHKPFSKAPSGGVNAVNDGVGLNNLTLGFNVAKYLDLRYTQPGNFSFDITSNLLKISNGVGLSASAGTVTEMFNGKVSELNNADKWDPELRNPLTTTEFVGKKWNINTRQLHSVIANFVNAPTTLTNKYLYVNGITSFALGTYYLDLHLLDSVVASFYSFDRSYNTTNNTVDVKFAKYSTAEVINWATSEQFTKCENFRPMINKKETFTLPVQIVNQLTETRFNIEGLIKQAVQTQMTSTSITWTQDPDYVPTHSPIRICPLSRPGSVLLHGIMHVNKEFPCRVIGFNRPSIVLIKSADGSTVTKITPDGILSTNKMITEILQLEPTNILQPGTQSYIGGEAFYGNINPTIGAVSFVPN